MAKLTRKKSTIREKDKDIDLETGDVSSPELSIWSISIQNAFVKCVSLVEQIKEKSLNVVDETNIRVIAYSLVVFGDKGKALFDQLCLFQSEFETNQLDELWTTAKEKSTFKTPHKFIALCNDKGIQAKVNEDEGWEYRLKVPGQPPKRYNDELTASQIEDIKEYQFIELNNCYYFAEHNQETKVCILVRKSNFTLRVLYHINRGKINKRVIAMTNIDNRSVTNDIETKQLSSLQAFKELTEGQGNFLFDGSNIELSKIKNKLFKLELPSKQIDMLGWNKQDRFFAFSNGLFTDRFHPVDEHGIVTLNDKNYFIPYHPGTDDFTNLNEKLFFYKPGSITFEQWSEKYCLSFGDAGKVALLFGIATLFSDHIFAVRRNFPMLFLYGEGGSGKSRVGTYLQFLWGEPQPPLKLSDRANTDKARIRKMAQYVNAMALFEEFINELEPNIIKTITGIYDRFGYERSNINSMYGTETVPINSTAFITGNSYPNDDPLMQRIIQIDYHANIRDEATVENYNKLTQLNREGLTHITGWLLQYRSIFVEQYESQFDLLFADFKKHCSTEGIVVPDRMCENYALILATHKVLQIANVKLPFAYDDLKTFLITTIRAQAGKRDVGDVTRRFWEIVQLLASERVIRNGKEFKFDGSKLSIRWTEIYGLYLERHQRMYRSQGLGKSTMLQKLTDSGALISESKEKYKVESGPRQKSFHGYVFDYDKLGIDLLSAVEYWDGQDQRYATTSPANYSEMDQNSSKKVTQVTRGDPERLTMENGQKPQNGAENDDLPF